MNRRTASSCAQAWANHSGAPCKWPALAFCSSCRKEGSMADMPQARLEPASL